MTTPEHGKRTYQAKAVTQQRRKARALKYSTPTTRKVHA